MGERHIRNLLALGHKEVVAVDPGSAVQERMRSLFGVQTASNPDRFINETEAVIIATPNHFHFQYIKKALSAGKHIFVEKPLVEDKHAILALRAKIEKDKHVFQVGYNLRFHPVLLEIKRILAAGSLGKIYGARIEWGSYLPEARPGRKHEENSAVQAKSGGLLLYDIHEINYAVWLFGRFKQVYCLKSKLSKIPLEGEDYLELLLTREDFIANIHMDHLQRKMSRKIKIIGEFGQIDGELYANELVTYVNGQREQKHFEFHFDTSYFLELEDFIAKIQGKNNDRTSFDEALYDLELVDAAKKSATRGELVTVSQSPVSKKKNAVFER